MTRIMFRDAQGRPVAGAVVAITAAPGEMTDIGYVTDAAGAISVPAPQPGHYGFILTGPDGNSLTAYADLGAGTEAEVVTRAE